MFESDQSSELQCHVDVARIGCMTLGMNIGVLASIGLMECTRLEMLYNIEMRELGIVVC